MYRSGDHYVICDTCGMRLLSSKSVTSWDGMICHPGCCDPRHPQELIRHRKEKISVKDSRPEGADVYLNVGDVTREDL